MAVWDLANHRNCLYVANAVLNSLTAGVNRFVVDLVTLAAAAHQVVVDHVVAVVVVAD